MRQGTDVSDNNQEADRKKEFAPSLIGKVRLTEPKGKSVGILGGGLNVSRETETDLTTLTARNGEQILLQDYWKLLGSFH